MKRYYITALVSAIAIITLASSWYIHARGKHLFILSGQSNMANLPLEESFIPVITKEFGKNHVIIVKEALGGMPIRHWYKKWRPAKGDEPKATGNLYDALMAQTQEAIRNQKIRTVTFIWMQGERDAKEQYGDVYAASLEGLIAQLENDLGRKDINVVIGRISDFGMSNADYPDWTKVREAQVKVAEAKPNRTWVNTDDLNDGKNKAGKEIDNRLHYSDEGYKILGNRFAESAINLIKKQGL